MRGTNERGTNECLGIKSIRLHCTPQYTRYHQKPHDDATAIMLPPDVRRVEATFELAHCVAPVALVLLRPIIIITGDLAMPIDVGILFASRKPHNSLVRAKIPPLPRRRAIPTENPVLTFSAAQEVTRETRHTHLPKMTCPPRQHLCTSRLSWNGVQSAMHGVRALAKGDL
jgi:hypothetical protein